MIPVLAAVLTMLPLGGGTFNNWDDIFTVARNPAYHPPTLHGVLDHWRRPFMDLYVPITYTVWGAVARVAYDPARGSLDPRIFHLFNIALHAFNASLVYLLLRRCLDDETREERDNAWAAAMGAVLFAVHPVQVETVGWVSGMKDLLCATLTLLALLGYVRTASSSRSPGGRRGLGYALGTVAFMLAMLSKPTALITPILAVVIDRVILRRSWRSVFKMSGFWLLLAIPCVVWTKLSQPALEVTYVPPLWLRPLIATDALAFYVVKILAPIHLTIDYGRMPSYAIERGWVYWTWLLPVAIGVVGWWCVRRQRSRAAELAVAGLALAVVPLLPLLGLVPFDFQQHSTVADHYLYLPMVGVSLALMAMVAAAPQRLRNALLLVIAPTICFVLAVRSAAQTRYWRDDRALFSHAVEVNPLSGVGYVNLASASLDAGSPVTALQLAERAVQLRPQSSQAHWVLGNAQMVTGHPAEAESSFRKSLEFGPSNATAPAALAALLFQQGRTEEAIVQQRRAMTLGVTDATAHYMLGIMLQDRGELDEAIREMSVAAATSRDRRVHAALGTAYAKAGRPDEARKALERALSLDPTYAPARQELDRLNEGLAR